MLEVIHWVSFAIMWAATTINVWAFLRCQRSYKRSEEVIAKANAIIFESIRKNSKHVVIAEGGKLCDYCQNGDRDCSVAAGANCVRFLPMEGTNLTSFDGVMETPPEIGIDEFSDLFVNWIESQGWRCIATYKPYKDEEEKE